MFLTLAIVDPVEIVDKASTASDRWLFLAALALLLSAGLWAIRYLVKDSAQIRADRQTERDQHAAWVATVYTENVKLTAQVLVVLQETNLLLKRIEKHLDDTK